MFRQTTSTKFLISLLLVLWLFGCKQNKNKLEIKKQCDSCCLKKLSKFAETLNFDTSKYFDYYFAEQKFSLEDCNLSKFRGDRSLKSSLVLIWLKIDNVYLKHRWAYSYVQDIGGISKTANQIVHEFYFLTNKEDRQWIEFLDPSDVNYLIKSDKLLLNNKQINKLFNENKALKKRKNHLK